MQKSRETASGSWNLHLEVAVGAVRAAGDLQIRAFNETHTVGFKGETDLVTEVDRACENEVVRRIQQTFPTHDFLLEETPFRVTGSPYLWVLDPLDGTTNYTHRYPHFCCSLALQHENKTVLGVVLDPFRNELFSAVRSGGAFLTGNPIRVSEESRLIRCLLATGFPTTIRTARETNLKKFSRMILHVQAIRRSGSAALDLCYLAAGRLDGYWVIQLAPWDVAAGALLVEEAGGMVTDLKGRAFTDPARGLLVSNGRIHHALLEILQTEDAR